LKITQIHENTAYESDSNEKTGNKIKKETIAIEQKPANEK